MLDAIVWDICQVVLLPHTMTVPERIPTPPYHCVEPRCTFAHQPATAPMAAVASIALTFE